MSTEQTPEELGYTPAATGREPLRFPIPPGAPERPCRSCGAPMIWTVTAAGKRMPLNPDGTSHFASCPNAAEHRKPKPKAPPERVLNADQVSVLRFFERGEYPDTTRTRFRIAVYECRAWGYLQPSNLALTPAGVEALAKARARRSR